jgi:cobalt/nickel transport system permease protein
MELTASGGQAFATVAGAMLGSHAWIGFGEGLLSTALYLALAPRFQVSVDNTARSGRPLALAGAALLLSPWASSLPDGLEATAARLGLPSGDMPLFAPLADYHLPALGQPQLSMILAGVCGALLTFGLARLMAARLQDRTAAGHI